MKPLVLCILDGVGIREETHGNAVKQAVMPVFNDLLNNYPHSLLEASGQKVGLPKGQMGNSEVGHTNIGAGRIVYQPLELINKSIEDKTFNQNENINKVIDHVIENKSNLHIMGLLSDGGIHSHINYLMALIDMLKDKSINVYYDLFLDGRDTLPNIAEKYLDILDKKIKETNIGKIATLSGRFYAMDRDNRWERVQKAYDAICLNKGEKYNNYKDALKANYDKEIYDEFIVPCIINEAPLKDNDGIIVFNHRPDRLRELFMAITNKNFNEFPHNTYKNIELVAMMKVSSDVICSNAFNHQDLTNTLGEYLSELGLKQLRIAETEKYAHVTYFFDGGIDKDLPFCKRILIDSPKVETYDLKPEMSAVEVTDALLKELDKEEYDVIILNYANGDMVGHTGSMKATIKALETLDKCLGKLKEKIEEKDGILLVTADHGNSDYMLDKENRVITSHSTSKVPFIINKKEYTLKNGCLADIAPTILYLLNKPIPKEMTGNVLVSKKQ